MPKINAYEQACQARPIWPCLPGNPPPLSFFLVFLVLSTTLFLWAVPCVSSSSLSLPINPHISLFNPPRYRAVELSFFLPMSTDAIMQMTKWGRCPDKAIPLISRYYPSTNYLTVIVWKNQTGDHHIHFLI